MSAHPQAAFHCSKSALIALQNDEFRRHLGDPSKTSIKGVIHLTNSVNSLPDDEQASLYAKIAAFDSFTESNDPWKERDYGSIDGYYFKIEYFENRDFEYGSPEPSNPDCTYRLMTIALVEEY